MLRNNSFIIELFVTDPYAVYDNRTTKLFYYTGLETSMANDTAQTITRIAEIIINELKLEDVTPQTFDPDLDLVDEVGVDSMDLATIALVLRDEYGIRIDEDDYPKLTTVRIIAQYIDTKLTNGE